jgi:hypothetical protein
MVLLVLVVVVFEIRRMYSQNWQLVEMLLQCVNVVTLNLDTASFVEEGSLSYSTYLLLNDTDVKLWITFHAGP